MWEPIYMPLKSNIFNSLYVRKKVNWQNYLFFMDKVIDARWNNYTCIYTGNYYGFKTKHKSIMLIIKLTRITLEMQTS